MLNKILSNYDLKDIINIIYLNFLLESNYIYFINDKNIENLYESITKFKFNDITYLYNIFFLKLDIKLFFLNEEIFLKEANKLFIKNQKEKKAFIMILNEFVEKIKDFNFSYLNSNSYLNSDILI